MIIYYIEITIQKDICKEWVRWMKKKHIPDMMATKMFIRQHFSKDEFIEYRYHISYELKNMNDYIRYTEEFAKDLQNDHLIRFKDKFNAKRRILTEMKNFH
tara:strand:- start:7 stop:309 length:303 start_codon:yes stop_codon:yes gene_type:complete